MLIRSRNGQLIRFVIRSTPKEQTVIVGVSAILLPIYYLSLEFPKLIVNSALSIVPPHFPHVIRILEWELASVGQVTLLVLYCLGLVGTQFAHGLIKLFVNVYKAAAGERVLLQMRRTLIRSLKDEARHEDAIHVGEGKIVSIITAELEPLSGFVAEAVATPVFEAGLLATAYIFIFQQNALIGFTLLILYPIQLLIVPSLQERQTRLEAERVEHVRALGDQATMLLHEPGKLAPERELHFERLVRQIYDARRAYYRIKFFINFLVNLLVQFILFGIYLYGGLLVVQGDLSVGALVAVVAAHKDLTSPWKELLDFWQLYRSSETKLHQIMTGIGRDPTMLDDLLSLKPWSATRQQLQ